VVPVRTGRSDPERHHAATALPVIARRDEPIGDERLKGLHTSLIHLLVNEPDLR
jgi:hypothetical protein